MRLSTLLTSSLILAACVFGQGCANVSAWERGNLAKEEMSINPSPNQNAFREHIFSSKEASQGGHVGAGGGCGCN